MSGEEKFINLQLSKPMKDSFKKMAKSRGTTMQGILRMFVRSYTENPDQFVLIMIDKEAKNRKK